MLVPRAGGLFDVASVLRGFAITTFDVPVDALAACLPRALEPDVVRLDDGRDRALVSAVTFLNTDFHVRFAPFVRLTAPQTNFRAYVRRGDERAVWFFGTTLGSPFVVMPRYGWRLPWAYGQHTLDLDFETTGHCRRLEFRASSSHGEEVLIAEGSGEPMGRLDGFADADTTSRVLTHPLIGYVRRTDGRCVSYGVDHDRLALERARAREARFELFERHGLVDRGQRPHSVLVMAETRFWIRLPPRPAQLDGA